MHRKQSNELNFEQGKPSKCAICGSADFKFLFKGYDYTYFCPQSFNVVKCLKCGMAGINPLPDVEYTYFAADSYLTSVKRDPWDFLNPDRAKLVERFKKRGRILDVGCGNGEFLWEMKKRGWEGFGNETSADRSNYAKKELGLENIYFGDLLSLDLPHKFFDVVTLWHVLEHLEKPVEVLKKISQILKDDGILIIESPDFGSCQRKFFKEKWFALGVPRHIHYFCPESLAGIVGLTGLTIFKKDNFVNPRTDFITLKRSMLIWLHLEVVPDKSGKNESLVLLGLKKYNRPVYKLLRIGFEMLCFLLSVFLSLINCRNTFRIYCRRSL